MIIEKNKYIDAVYIKTAHGTLKIYENDFSFPGVSIDYALDGYEIATFQFVVLKMFLRKTNHLKHHLTR